jgi:hypothetical protein
MTSTSIVGTISPYSDCSIDDKIGSIDTYEIGKCGFINGGTSYNITIGTSADQQSNTNIKQIVKF